MFCDYADKKMNTVIYNRAVKHVCRIVLDIGCIFKNFLYKSLSELGLDWSPVESLIAEQEHTVDRASQSYV